MLERYCGRRLARRSSRARRRRSTGRASTVEPFDVGGDAPRYLDGSGAELEASGFVVPRPRGGGVVTYVPGLARLDDAVLDRFAASDLVLVDGTFWRDDELAAARHLGRARARDMGHVAALGPRRDARGARRPASGRARRSSTSTTPTRSCSRTRPSATRSLARGRRSRLRWPRGRAMTESATRPRSSTRRRRRRSSSPRCARRARATTTCTRSTGGWTPASSRARSCSAGSRTASTTRSASRSRTRRSCPTAPRSRSGASGSSGSSTTTARPTGTGGIESWLRLGEALGVVARRAACRSGGVLPGVRYAVDAYVNFARQRPWIEAVASSLTELFGPAAIRVRLEALERHYAVDRPRGARVLPHAARAGAARRAVRARPRPSSAAARASSRTPPSRRCASRPRCCGRSSTRSSAATRSRPDAQDA